MATLRKIGIRGTPRPHARRSARGRRSRSRALLPADAASRRATSRRSTTPCSTAACGLLELEGLPASTAEEWAELDREVVEQALIAPYGVEQTGVLLSERMDAVNCRRFHPVYGLDWSSLCLR